MVWSMLARGAQDAFLILCVSLAASALFALLIAAMARALLPHVKEQRFAKAFLEIFFVAAPFGVVGMTCGFLTGVSRSPAVTALVPGALTLFGGLVAYLMSRGAAQAVLAAVAAVTFS